MGDNVLLAYGINCAKEIVEDLSPEQEQNLRKILQFYISGSITYEEAVNQTMSILHSPEPVEKIRIILNIDDTPLPPHTGDDENEHSNRKKTRTWTPEEDYRLLKGVYKFGENWNAIMQFVGNSRNRSQCSQRWVRVLDPGINKGPWTQEEDMHLLSLVEQYGTKQWVKVAAEIPSRSDVQCRYHYSQLQGKGGNFDDISNDLPKSRPKTKNKLKLGKRESDDDEPHYNLLTTNPRQPVVLQNTLPKLITSSIPQTIPQTLYPTNDVPMLTPLQKHKQQHMQLEQQSQSKISNKELEDLANRLKLMSPMEVNQVLSLANYTPQQPGITSQPYIISAKPPQIVHQTTLPIQQTTEQNPTPQHTGPTIKLPPPPPGPNLTLPPFSVVPGTVTGHQGTVISGDGKNLTLDTPLLLKNSSDIFRSNQLFDSSFWN